VASAPAALRSDLASLASPDVLERDRARHRLVWAGSASLGPLIAALPDADRIARWEIVKALGEIRDAAAAPALIELLDDQRFDLRWLAAEGLIALDQDGIPPLLRSLEHAAWDNVWLREGAHHILRSQLSGPLGPTIAPVVAALEGSEPGLSVPLAAFQALNTLGEPSS
jgi:HEAT repeat protein